MTDDWFNYSDRYSPTTHDYWFDIHPRTETQYRRQQFISGIPIIGSWYGNYMRQKSDAELQKENMERLGITWSEIKRPWSAGMTSANVNASYSSGANIVSSNIKRLYR